MTTRFQKPRILLVDLPSEWSVRLRQAGYSADEGTFGQPYSVEPSDLPFPALNKSAWLPDYHEQEIVLVNAAEPEARGEQPPAPGLGVESWWQSAVSGLVDPHPLAMLHARQPLGQILDHGAMW